ncbi:prominin-2 isoform X2 [Hippocampus zosterae]|uniref:prominin-2 isoform X2 n=1 Tax=Hippocampus zosterae TaxID=109293 RepID=UPI00223DF1CF|nr:prominin-2 isoform X2 [Hippocampus zosterae]
MRHGMVAVLRAIAGFWILGGYLAAEQNTACNLQDMPSANYSDLSDKTTSFMANLVNGFLSVIQPQAFPAGLIEQAVRNMSILRSDKYIQQVLAYGIGFVVCAVIGLLYILLMPIVGSVIACCRFAGKCGGEIYQEQTHSILKERRNLYWSTAIITIFLLVGNICMFESTWEFRARLDQSQIKLNNTFDNIKAFLRILDKQFQHVGDQSSNMVDNVEKNIKAVDELMTLQKDLNNKMADEKTNFNNLKSRITNDLTQCVTSDCDNLRTNLETTNLPSDFTNTDMENKLTTVRDQLEASISTDKLRDITNNLDALNLNNIKTQISQKVNDISQKLNMNQLLGRVENLQNNIQLKRREVDRAESIRWGVSVSMCLVVLLVVLCNVLGLILGPLGLKPTQEPRERSNVANCGGIILIIGASLSVLVSWLLMLAVTLLFLLGGNVHTLVCKPWSSGELLQFAPTVIPQLDLGKTLNLKGNFTLSSIYSECGENKSLWSTLQLEKSYGSQINQYLKIDQHIKKIDDINFNVPQIFDKEFKSNLQNIQTDRLTIDTTQLDDTIKNFRDQATASNEPIFQEVLNRAADDLTKIKTSITMSINPKLEDVIKTIKVIKEVGNTLVDTQNALNTKDIKDKIKKFLQSQLSPGLDCIGRLMKVEFGRCGALAEVVDSAQTILCLYLVASLNAFWFSLGWCAIFFIPSIILSVKLAKHYRRMKYADITKKEYSSKEMQQSPRAVST